MLRGLAMATYALITPDTSRDSGFQGDRHTSSERLHEKAIPTRHDPGTG